MKPIRLAAVTVGGAALVSSAILSIAVLASQAVRDTLGVSARLNGGYVEGEVVDLPPSIYRGTFRTVAVFARGDCAACVRSHSQLRVVLAEATERSWRCVLLAPSERPLDREYAQSLGLPGHSVAVIPPPTTRVALIPTVLVLDSRGRILFAHSGLVNDAFRSTWNEFAVLTSRPLNRSRRSG